MEFRVKTDRFVFGIVFVIFLLDRLCFPDFQNRIRFERESNCFAIAVAEAEEEQSKGDGCPSDRTLEIRDGVES